MCQLLLKLANKIFGWQEFFEVLEKVLTTGGEHLQLKAACFKICDLDAK